MARKNWRSYSEKNSTVFNLREINLKPYTNILQQWKSTFTSIVPPVARLIILALLRFRMRDMSDVEFSEECHRRDGVEWYYCSSVYIKNGTHIHLLLLLNAW